MNEELMYRIMAITAMVVTACSAIATVVLLCLTVTDGMTLLIPTVLLALCTVGAGLATAYYGERLGGAKKVFDTGGVEREVLTLRQRRELRRARGGLVMQRALVDIENERDNIIHREIEAAEDPDKPPHQTTLTPEPMKEKPLRIDEGGYVRPWEYDR